MKIDINEKINQYLLNIEQNNARLVEERIGKEAIDDYLSNFTGYDNIVSYSVSPFNKLDIKNFGDFEILKMVNQDCEIVMLAKDKQIILKMISILGTSCYKNSCDGVTLSVEKKNTFKDTDIYISNEHIIKNRVMYDKLGNINAEIFSANYESNGKVQEYLYDMNSSLNVAYSNNLPTNIEIMWYHRPVDKEYLSTQLGVNVENPSGMMNIVSEINDDMDHLLQELNKFIYDTKELIYMKRK